MAVRARRNIAQFWFGPTSQVMSAYKGQVFDGDVGNWLAKHSPNEFEEFGETSNIPADVVPIPGKTLEQAHAEYLAAKAAGQRPVPLRQPGDVSSYPDPRQAAEAERRYAERVESGDVPDGLVELHARIAGVPASGDGLDTGPRGVQADGTEAAQGGGSAPSDRRPSPAWDRTDTPIVPGVASGPSDQDIRDRDAAQAAADGIARGSDVFEVASDVDEDADDDEGDPHEPAAEQSVGKFDPSEHTGPEVIEYAKKHPAERARLRAAEKSGKARTTVLVALAD
jgi:hypothetical protein